MPDIMKFSTTDLEMVSKTCKTTIVCLAGFFDVIVIVFL